MMMIKALPSMPVQTAISFANQAFTQIIKWVFCDFFLVPFDHGFETTAPQKRQRYTEITKYRSQESGS